MSEEDETPPPALVTPLESAYIRAAITAVLPAINGLIYATNLDQVLHITKLTTNQVWQAANALMVVASVFLTIKKRIKDGKDPRSSAPRIVMSRPVPPKDEFADILKDTPPQLTVPPPHLTDEDLVALIQKQKKQKPNNG